MKLSILLLIGAVIALAVIALAAGIVVFVLLKRRTNK